MIKLHVLLRDQGVASRRGAEEMIADGRVLVNGKVAHIGQLVEGTEDIIVDGKAISSAKKIQAALKRYFLLDKPVGVTSTTEDYHAESMVIDLLPNDVGREALWQIAGRLDRESEGLMLITNDGDVVYTLTHPKFEVQKVYEVLLSKELLPEEESQLLAGMVGKTGELYKLLGLKRIADRMYEIILTEGKKREIREALGSLGIAVWQLRRTVLGPLQLSQLQGKRVRELTPEEIINLRNYVKERTSLIVGR